MPWTVVEDERFEHCEDLVRDDDGQVIGTIMRFRDDGPTYAWTISGGRIGPISPLKPNGEWPTGAECDAAARNRVEKLAGLSPKDQNFATSPASGATTPH